MEEEVLEKYHAGDFAGAKDLCYQQLTKISNTSDESLDGYDAGEQMLHPFLLHHCLSSSCACKHFLSILVQLMYELQYPESYIFTFVSQFYHESDHLPLLCAGLLSSILIHQEKFQEAQKMLEEAIGNSHAKMDWTVDEIDTYYHALSILILHVLIPQEKVALAREYCGDGKHPSSVLPVRPIILQEVEETLERKKNEEEIQNESTEEEISDPALTSPPAHTSSTSLNTNNRKNPKTLKTQKNAPSRLRMLLGMQMKLTGRLLLPCGVIALLVAVAIYITKNKKSAVLVSMWDLVENAVFPNSTRRLQQRNSFM